MNLGGSQTGKPMAIPSSIVSWKSSDVVPDQFPAGLRVLVVDDDPTCLRILEKMLRNCLYEVTKCNRAEIALKLLQDNRNGYDIVISDVHMPDMDGFKLLEQVGLQMDLPVIMMSADDSKSVVMKGVTHGACDYLIKPVRIEALKNIWQHVVRKKKHEWKEKDFEQYGSVEDGERQLKPLEDVDYPSPANEGSFKNPKRRKDDEDELEEKDDTSSLKKPRVVWCVELHQQFVTAVNQLGIDKAVPKKILELMNVPGLTRENVASHLQKYRLYLRRLQLQNGINSSFMGNPESTFGSMSSIGGLDFQGLAAPGQIQAQSLASLQAAALGRPTSKSTTSMPMVDQRNLFSFETQKLRYGEGQQQLNGNSKQHMNLLHGIPTNMEPKQLASLNQSAQKFGGLNVQANSQASQGNSLLMQATQPMSRPHILNENNANQISRLPSSIGQSILSNGIPSGVLGRSGIVDGVRGPVYSSSLVDFSVNNSAELPCNPFHHASTAGISNLSCKAGMIQEEVSSELKSSIGFSPSYDIFSELQQHKVQDWGVLNVGSTFDASRLSNIQGSLDVSTSNLDQPVYSSSQKSQHRISDTIFSGGEGGGGQNSTSDFGQHFNNSFTPQENSFRIKSEILSDASCQNNLFTQQFGQEGIGSVESDLLFDAYAVDNGYALDNLPV